MDRSRKENVLKILDYWRTVELLGQNDIPEPNKKTERLIRILLRGDTLSEEEKRIKKIECFHQLTTEKPYIYVDKVQKEDGEKFPDFPEKEEEVGFCIGRINRNQIVDYLSKYYKDKEEEPELAYPKESSIACCSFKVDPNGDFKKDSFCLSPLLWAIREWEKSRVKPGGDFALDPTEYEAIVNEYNGELEGKSVDEFLERLWNRIYEDYVRNPFPDIEKKSIGFCVYRRYKDEKTKKRDLNNKNKTDYTDLGQSFFMTDMVLISEMIKNNQFGDNSEYERRVIDYILSAYEQKDGGDVRGRTNISPTQDRESMRHFFTQVLDVNRAPLGKWPARFMPALMQQVAVNLAIEDDPHTTVFSVNGPPGTGKTTLLKEVIANNIVERARLLCAYEYDPDDAFEERSFKQGFQKEKSYSDDAPHYYALKDDRINNYGMLVTSCNNAAVENITTDLPKGEDILDSLKSDPEKDPVSICKGLEEIHSLFDVACSDDIERIQAEDGTYSEEKDIYFTRYANGLLEKNDCWGLISAPFGKREKITNYANKVLNPFVKDYNSDAVRQEHLLRYRAVRKEFLSQLKLVEEMCAELEQYCKAYRTHPHLVSVEGKGGINFEEDLKMKPVDDTFLDQYFSKDEKLSTKAQVTNPWFTDRYNRAREKLFFYACKVHKEFVISSKCMMQNIINLLISWNLYSNGGDRMKGKDRQEAVPVLLQSIFLMTPVISTTFASAQTFMKDIRRGGVIGTLIVDESGQAQPQMSIGSLLRCRKAMIVGDPKQIEPVVTAEADMIKNLMTDSILDNYKKKDLSVQGFADTINPYGTFLGEGDEKQWVGCPLVVHRRCIDPMYTISNVLSYDGTMKQQTGAPKPEREAGFILDKSYWIDVKGNEAGSKNHFVEAQGRIVLKLLSAKLRKTPEAVPKLFIITPFTSVKDGMEKMIRNSELGKEKMIVRWLSGTSIGTVHTFQGQGTDEVIFLLGCDEKSVSAANWVNKNIVNVAATRAKFRLYTIGDQSVWTCKPVKTARERTGNVITEEELNQLLQAGLKTEKAAEAVPEKKGYVKSDWKAENKKPWDRRKTADQKDSSEWKAKKLDMKGQTAQEIVGICPRCGKPLKKKYNSVKKVWFLGCTGYRRNDPSSCSYTKSIKE